MVGAQSLVLRSDASCGLAVLIVIPAAAPPPLPHLPFSLQLTPLWAPPPPLSRFFQFFDQLRRLRMWKMQLLDEHHLFIKYTSEDVVTLRVTDPSQVCACALSCCPLLPCKSFVFYAA